MKQYQTHLHKWDNYCQKKGVSPYFASVSDGLNFLTECYESGYSYSRLNTARSALSSVLYLPTGTFGSHPLVNRLMKGVFNSRPSLSKYRSTWDVNLVLDYLKQIPLETVSLKQLSHKCVMLLALLTAQRIQTIKKMTVQNVSFTFQGCEIFVNSVLKTTKPGKHLDTLKLPCYSNEDICVVTHLKKYLSMTQSLRGDVQQLFITINQPHKGVTTDTVARWLRSVMASSGVDTTTYGPHSTRAASVSQARRNNTCIDTILAAGGWTNAKTFAKFYNKPLNDGAFASAIFDSNSP